ncbi:UNVERIFIED_CONTAM: hypothetical protein FKN15_039818 [Acipenser sinensis]
MKWIFKLYWNSPKRRRDAKEIARVIDENFAHFSDVKQARWVSRKTRTLDAMQQNLQVVVLHLGQVGSGSDESAAKARKFLAEVTSINFINTLECLRDILEPVSHLSELFQSNDLMLLHVQPTVEQCALRLVELKNDPGVHIQQFQMYHPEKSMFVDDSAVAWEIKLSGHCPPAARLTRNARLTDKMVKYIDERFSNFNCMPAQGFKVFDDTLWPENREKLSSYAKSD